MDESRKLGTVAAAGSAALLAGAFFFQAIGYAPCAMCLWQRWPHAVAILAGALLLVLSPYRALLGLGAAAMIVTSGLGLYHTGVERDWWEGPSSCTGSGAGLSGLSGDALLSFDDVPPLVLCDEVTWQFLSLSMASWNAILSALLAGVWILALRGRSRST